MKIKMTKEYNTPLMGIDKGAEIDRPKAFAKELIKDGYAVEVKGKAAKKEGK